MSQPLSAEGPVRQDLIVAPSAATVDSTPAALPPISPADRVQIDGKFFRLGARKFHPKGVTYGPFQPGSRRIALPAA